VIDASTGVQTLIASEAYLLSSVAAGAVLFSSRLAQVPAQTNYFVDLYLATLRAPGVPGVPGNLTYSTSGSMVNLAWTAPAVGDPPTGYIVASGSQPGRTDDVILRTGSTATSFAVAVAAGGTYYVRVYATNATGTGPPSNEIAVRLGAGYRPPGQPRDLQVSLLGHDVV